MADMTDLIDGEYWFRFPTVRIVEHLGYNLNERKVANLADISSEDLMILLNLLCVIPNDLRKNVGDEFVNIILGPMSIALKEKHIPFKDWEKVFRWEGLYIWAECEALGLIPTGSRKELYEALIKCYNKNFDKTYRVDYEWAQYIFYDILVNVLEPIFDQASTSDMDILIKKHLEENPKQAEQAKNDSKIVGFFMGKVLKEIKVDPNTLRVRILEIVNE